MGKIEKWSSAIYVVNASETNPPMFVILSQAYVHQIRHCKTWLKKHQVNLISQCSYHYLVKNWVVSR